MPQITLMKAEYLILLSFLLTLIVITNAFYIKRQFYPTVLYLTKSSTSLAVLYAQAFVFVILFGKLVQRIFLGQLRQIETEHLYDRTWFSITETCLAFTVFRDDFSPHFVALFAILLFIKCFHWLLEDRIDYMQQSAFLQPIFHVRIIGLMSVLFLFDNLFISLACANVIAKGASFQIVFGFEYAILLITVITSAIKYTLHLIEIRLGEQWENKSVYLFCSDLICQFFHVTLYIIFVTVMMKIHTTPLFAMRPMFIALRAFHKSCNDLLESRRAIRYLNTMYPDLTAEELTNVTDTTCIICREEMQVQQSIKRLSCQHIFHKNCLCSWFQRQQTCPTCRITVLHPTPPPTAPPPFNAQPAAAPQAQAPEPPTEVDPPPATSVNSNSTTTTIHASSPNTNPIGIGTSPQMLFNSVPMVLPPFAFPPPPLPPINFTGLSEEAIRAMEETELAHVQARLQCLNNVKTLLDALLSQLQQYTNIISTQRNVQNNPVLSSVRNINSANNLSNPIDENDNTLIRRQRLEHFAN